MRFDFDRVGHFQNMQSLLFNSSSH